MGRWVKGQSGNPTGRAKSDHGRAALRQQIAEKVPAIVSKMVALALKGDVQAARTLLERVLPPVRPETVATPLPALADAAGFSEQAAAIVKAAGVGEVPFDAAAQLLGGIAAAARTAEIDELARRVAALEGERPT